MATGAVDLSDYVEDLEAELNVPGATSPFAAATETEWLNQLRTAFWEAVLDGVITGYTESDGIVKPQSGTTPLSREYIQIVIYNAGMRVIRNKLVDLKTSFKAVAGPVQYEVQQSAQVLRSILDDLVSRRQQWVTKLGQQGLVSTYYIDAVLASSESTLQGWTDWIYP